MNNFNFTPAEGHMNKEYYPTKPASEEEAREMLQRPLNQVKDFINNDLLTSGFENSKNTNGYTKLPNGMIIQWGRTNIDSNKLQVITYPTSFPLGTVSVSVVEGENSGGVNYGSYKVDGTTKTNFNLWRSGTGTMYVYWMAIGY